MSERGKRPKMMHGGHYVPPWTLPAVKPSIQRYLDDYRQSLALIQGLPERLGQIDQDRELSDHGKTARRASLADEVAPVLKKARESIAAGVAEIDRLRGEMMRSSIDKTDMAAAMVRSEIRSWLRSMPDGQRTALLTVGVSPEVTAAIVEAPPELSGVSQDRRDALQEQAMVLANPDKAAEIAEIEEALSSLVGAEAAAAAVMKKSFRLTDGDLAEKAGGLSFLDRQLARLRDAGLIDDDQQPDPENDDQPQPEAA